MTEHTDAMWQAFRAANPDVEDRYDAYSFGDGPAMADELIELVMHGPKRATAGLLRSYLADNESVPRVGDHSVLLDGARHPRCIVRVTDVQVIPFDHVDTQFAWDEGEGDRSLVWWLAAHRGFFAREAEREGFEFHEEMETVLERFTVVWPPEVADAAH